MYGMVHIKCYKYCENRTWFSLSFGVLGTEEVYCRIHDACITSEVFSSQKCDCNLQLHDAMAFLQKQGGLLIYTPQEGRGCGIMKKIQAYSWQMCDGLNTMESDLMVNDNTESRNYNVVKNILDNLHVKSIRLISNNPYKLETLRSLNIKCELLSPRFIYPWKQSLCYLSTKQKLMNHAFDVLNLDMTTMDCMNHIQTEVRKCNDPVKIVMSFATSINGVYCNHDKSPLKISNDRTMRLTQFIRSICDTILVGSHTILNDNPFLDCRIPGSSEMTKIILTRDPSKIHPNFNVFKNGTTYILTTSKNDNNIRTIHFDGTITDCIDKLSQLGCKCLMVEGGNTILQQFIHYSTLVVWTQNLNMIDGCKFELKNCSMENQKVFTFDDNIVVCANVKKNCNV